MDHVVRKILVQICQTVGILTQSLVLASQSVSSGNLPELDQIDDIKSRNVIFATSKMIPPISLLPEPESLHVFIAITEWSVTIGSSTKIKFPQLQQVSPDDLVRVHKDDFLEIERKENIKEQYFVSPDDSLFIGLLVQPSRPLVLNIFVLKSVPLGIFRNKVFQGWRQEVLQDPELDWCFSSFE